MNKKEKFAYDIDFGAIMDYVENRFMLVIISMFKSVIGKNICLKVIV